MEEIDMKNKGPLFAMIGILIFAIVMFIQPWKYFQTDTKQPAQQQTAEATETTQATQTTPAAAETTDTPAAPETVSEDVAVEEGPTPTIEHDPANLYDIDKSDFMNE